MGLNFIFLSIVFVYILVNYIKAKKQLKDKIVLYKYCDLRRELMKVLRNNEKIKANSVSVLFLYRILSHFIHYKINYNFLSYEFLKNVYQDEKDIENKHFHMKFRKDALEQDKILLKIAKEFTFNTLRAFNWHNKYFLLFLVFIIQDKIIKGIFKTILRMLTLISQRLAQKTEFKYRLFKGLQKWDESLANG